jgi:L-alanine-DL-glutamate epimerase-like enolase superfamily enzyme
VIVCSHGRNFVTLKITTEDGVYGLGDGTLKGRELAVASYAMRAASRTAGNTSIRGILVADENSQSHKPVCGKTIA